MVRAYSTCLAVRCSILVVGEEPGQDEQAVQRRAQLVRHVGEEVALVPGRQVQLPGALLDRCRACSISPFLISISRFCRASCAALSSSSAFDLCRSLSQASSSPVLTEAHRQPLGLLQQVIGAGARDDLFTLTPMVSISCSRKSWCAWVNRLNGPPRSRPGPALEHDGQDDEVDRRAVAEPEEIRT